MTKDDAMHQLRQIDTIVSVNYESFLRRPDVVQLIYKIFDKPNETCSNCKNARTTKNQKSLICRIISDDCKTWCSEEKDMFSVSEDFYCGYWEGKDE